MPHNTDNFSMHIKNQCPEVTQTSSTPLVLELNLFQGQAPLLESLLFNLPLHHIHVLSAFPLLITKKRNKMKTKIQQVCEECLQCRIWHVLPVAGRGNFVCTKNYWNIKPHKTQSSLLSPSTHRAEN